ncbi:hypothetical protein CB0940_07476 [Lecanosticta acicola]|uniref:Uncharacterized protein n=1 Tax=Lecanosticta acicola TaxID=111012 RepID=A0AAI9EF08_9PEZI|nr:hypothetical protein CB0940_07476 [Lecanosticta acicola]
MAYSSQVSGPVPGDDISVYVNGTTLSFSDGHSYTFIKKPHLLAEALRLKEEIPRGADPTQFPIFNNWLAKVGDKEMEAICRKQMYENEQFQERLWQRNYAYGMGMNSYLAWQADSNGVSKLITKEGLPGTEWEEKNEKKLTEHERATTVEALIGAVEMDSRNEVETMEVMRRLGVWWPCTEKEEELIWAHLQQMRDLGVIPRR